MRFTSVFTLLCALAALILSFLCLFAGSNKSFLQNGELMTLNISRIGQTDLFNTTSSGDDSFFDTLINGAQGALEDFINGLTDDLATALNLSDFYSVHIMNYCRGEFEPNGTAKSTHENITYCSPRNSLFHFSLTQTVQDNLPSGITLQDIHWPQEIEDAERAIKAAATAMFIFYVLAIVFIGLAVLGALWGIFTSGRLSALLNFVLDSTAFLTLGIASALATVIVVKAVNAVNKYGNDIGIAANKGALFLGMTWAATALMLLASMMSVVQCVVGRRHHKTRRSEMREKGSM